MRLVKSLRRRKKTNKQNHDRHHQNDSDDGHGNPDSRGECRGVAWIDDGRGVVELLDVERVGGGRGAVVEVVLLAVVL